MLPTPKDWIATQECVGGDTKGSKPAATRPAAKVQFAVDMEALCTRTQATKQNQRAPIEMVSGHVHGGLLGSEAARENPRCTVGESVYLLFHF